MQDNMTGIMVFAPQFKTGNKTFIKAGFIDGLSTSWDAQVDGAYFNISETNVSVVTSNNSVRQMSAWTNNILSSGQFYTAIIKTYKNTTGRQVNFYMLNDSGSQIFQANLTTNIPLNELSRETRFGFCAYTKGGTTAQGVALLDFIMLDNPYQLRRGGGAIPNYIRTLPVTI
jgi:hypothetical protein